MTNQCGERVTGRAAIAYNLRSADSRACIQALELQGGSNLASCVRLASRLASVRAGSWPRSAAASTTRMRRPPAYTPTRPSAPSGRPGRRAQKTKKDKARPPAAAAPRRRLDPQAAHLRLRRRRLPGAERRLDGQPGFPTPTGVFSVIQKNRYHRSNIYSGAPMPFMQRITWSGVAMHAGVAARLSGLARLHPPDRTVRGPSCGA